MRRLVLAALVAALVAALLLPLGGTASAEPIPLDAYRHALGDLHERVVAARALTGFAREQALERAMAALDALAEVRVDGAIYTAPPHEPVRALLRRGDDASLDLAAGMLLESVAALDRARVAGGTDLAQARRQLEAVFESSDFERVPDWRDVVAELLRRFLSFALPGLRAPTIEGFWVTIGAVPVAVALAALVLWVSGAGLRERVRREVALRAATAAPRSLSREHLRAAEEALAAGRARDAVRELFLFALYTLEERELLRFDPALTDREVLARAAGLPHVGDLAALADVYERAWYGVREPSAAELARARELARRIAA